MTGRYMRYCDCRRRACRRADRAGACAAPGRTSAVRLIEAGASARAAITAGAGSPAISTTMRATLLRTVPPDPVGRRLRRRLPRSRSGTSATAYRSLSSEDFAAALERELEPGTIMARRGATTLVADGVTLGRRRADRRARRDRLPRLRPHSAPAAAAGRSSSAGTCAPTGRTACEHPVIMDATVDQADGYRFVYVLPLGADELFIEDTYYQDDPAARPQPAVGPDRRVLRAPRLARRAARLGNRRPAGGDRRRLRPLAEPNSGSPGVARAGAHAGFVHPLTSYTLPFAAETALAMARDADLPGDQLAAMLEARARQHWRRTRFYRLLGSMLFGGARSRRALARVRAFLSPRRRR